MAGFFLTSPTSPVIIVERDSGKKQEGGIKRGVTKKENDSVM